MLSCDTLLFSAHWSINFNQKNSLRKRIQGKYKVSRWKTGNDYKSILSVGLPSCLGSTHQHGQVREKKHAFTLLPNEHLNLTGALEIQREKYERKIK